MKKIIAILAVCMMLLPLCAGVLASSDHVVDDAGILTFQQDEDLSTLAGSIADTYGMDVAIVIVSSLDGKTAQAYADDYYDDNGYGFGEDYSGILFLLAVDDREYAVSTCGEAIDALSDRDIDLLLDCVLDDFRSGKYYQGLRTYLETLEGEFYYYTNGERPQGQETEAEPQGPNYLAVSAISLAVGAGAGGIGLASMRSGMKTAKPQVGAQSYLANNSFALPVNQNTFLYSRTSRTRIQSSSSIGGGRGSTHTSSSGRRHGGGSRKF